MNKWLMVLGVITLAGCSSKPTNLNYYTLHDPAVHAKNRSVDSSLTFVEMPRVKLPDYLKHKNLAFQKSDTELHYAPQHVWSEPLYDGIYQTLGKVLLREHNIYVAEQLHHLVDEPDAKLLIKIDDFMATYNGQIILSGQYWITKDGKRTIKLFQYTSALSKDGYPHAVTKMREVLTQLAQDAALVIKE